MSNQQVAVRKDLKATLEAYKPRLQEILKDRAPQFSAALVQIVNKTWQLQKCKPESIVGAAITAAALDLSVDPGLGEAYLVPYGDMATFQIGYKGIISLCQRSGQYKRLGWMVVYDGQLKKWNPLTGELEVDVTSKKANGAVIGYAAYFQLLNGFERGEYWTKDEITAHAARFSQAYKAKKKDSPWMQDGPSGFDKMALKTVLFALLRPFGPKSVQWITALNSENTVRISPDAEPESFLDIETEDGDKPPETPVEPPAPSNTPSEGEKAPQSSAAQQATPPNAPEEGKKEVKKSLQEELAGIVTAPPAIYTFTEFAAWLEAEQDVKDASSLPGFEAIHDQLCKRFIRSKAGMLAQLAARRLAT